MTKILILFNRNKHLDRLILSMQILGFETKAIQLYEDIPIDKHYITFIDPSIEYDPLPKLNSDIKIFFDCEDDPLHCDYGPVFETLKYKIHYYAKMNWIPNTVDDCKIIGFPCYLLPMYSYYANKINFHLSNNYIPLLIASGTFIGCYKPRKNINLYPYNDILDIKSIGRFFNKNNNTIELCYNQRIDWFLSMIQNNIKYYGGLVFGTDNQTKEWQSLHFGTGVTMLETNKINYNDFFELSKKYNIALCPTGYARMSWRMFDIMAAGSIMLLTDIGDMRCMYMPLEYTIMEDECNFGEKYIKIQSDFPILHKAAQKNKDLIASLTLDKMKQDFLYQLK